RPLPPPQRARAHRAAPLPDVRRALVAIVVAALAPAPAARAEQDGGTPFGAPLSIPNLGPAHVEQDPLLPSSCDLPPKDARFKALGTTPGPAAVAHHGGGRAIDGAGPG